MDWGLFSVHGVYQSTPGSWSQECIGKYRDEGDNVVLRIHLRCSLKEQLHYARRSPAYGDFCSQGRVMAGGGFGLSGLGSVTSICC